MDDALKAMRDGARKFSDEAEQIDKTRGMGGNRRSLYEERQQIDRVYAKSDQGKVRPKPITARLTRST